MSFREKGDWLECINHYRKQIEMDRENSHYSYGLVDREESDLRDPLFPLGPSFLQLIQGEEYRGCDEEIHDIEIDKVTRQCSHPKTP